MKLQHITFATLILVLTFCACSTINVHHVDSNATLPENGGIYYSLPKAALTIEVTVNKTYKVKGPYASYASKYLGLSNVITENSTSYSLGDIQVKSYTLADPDQYYFVELPKKCKKSSGLFLKLSETGVITGINDFSKAKPTLNTDTTQQEQPEEMSVTASQLSNKSNIAETIDTIIEKVTLDTITFEKKVLKKTLSEKNTEQKAKDAVDFIMRVKESKFNLLTGYSEVNYSKESIDYMNGELSEMETEYMNLFTGKTVIHQLKYYYTYTPASTENSTYLPLFRFSAKEGIVDTSSYYGESVYLRIERSGSTRQVSVFEKAKVDPKATSHGFYYRIPEYAKVSLIYNDKAKTEKNILFPQFGAVCELPAGKKMSVSLYPNSGSLKTIAVKKRGLHCFGRH